MINAEDNRAEFLLAVDKIGLVNLIIKHNEEQEFDFLITDQHLLAKDFSDIYSVR